MTPGDEIALAAAKRACAQPIFHVEKRREAQLVAALCRALKGVRSLDVPRMECRFPLTNWTRPPGGVDLSVRSRDGSISLLIETKVGKPEEAIWDIIKLADIRVLDRSVTDTYLVYTASTKVWTRADNRSPLLSDRERLWTVREMIGHADADWAWLLKGGRGIRPMASVGKVRLTTIGAYPMKDAGQELRLIKVRPEGRTKQQFDAKGAPVE
jgi:hypothetical protein